jgi:Flp pilus assembly protein TadD
MEKERPLECVQKPGELMYVPESWWHGTINEGGGGATTLSVAAQRRKAATKVERQVISALGLKVKGRNKMAFKKLQSIVKNHPEHAEAWYTLGIVYGRVREHHLKDELEAKLKALELTGGRNCDVMNNVATALIHHERAEEAEKYLLQVIEMCPWDDFAWSNLAAALDTQDREEEAVAAFDKGKKVREEWSTPSRVTVGKEELML